MPDRDGLVLPKFLRHAPPQLSMRSITCVPYHSFITKVSTESIAESITESIAIMFPLKDNFILTVCPPKERIILSVTHQKAEIVTNSVFLEDLVTIISISTAQMKAAPEHNVCIQGILFRYKRNPGL